MTSDHHDVLASLTLEEKASLCSGSDFWRTQPVPRVGIEALLLTDGPHGVRKQAEDFDHIGLAASVPSTCFPTAAALGSSWDVDLVRRVGAALGGEARAEQVAVLLGPGINIKRSPLCGRNFEYLSEDPVLSGELGAAYVDGVQSQGVGTSLKHYAANNQETDRMRVSAEVDERTLREIYLNAFERVVRQARPWTVMCSYNKINAVYASQNPWLLTEVLRNEWGFDGLVMSDWGAVDDRVAGLAAGLDLEMPSSHGYTDAQLVAAVKSGTLDEKVLDVAVARLLDLLDRVRPALAAGGAYDQGTHHDLAREVARDCAVLLKNDGGLLPLDPIAAGSLAVIGEFARVPRYQGAGSSQVNPTRLDTALEEIRALTSWDVTFAAGYGVDAPDSSLVAAAAAEAAAADVVLLFLGLPPSYESEGWDRDHMDLPDDQLELVRAVSDSNSRVVVVLSNGSAVAMDAWQHRVPAILEGWLLGQAGGGALADLIFGVASPSGRLAETIPLRLQDNPSFGNFPGEHGTVRYGEGVLVGYRHYDTKQLAVGYPFGHGLSYTTFGYSAPTATVKGSGAQTRVEVAVTVTNTGPVAGREVVQVYVRDPVATVLRPERELKAFAKVTLAAGESQAVTFSLDGRDLAFFHSGLRRWVVEDGEVEIEVGASSRDLRGRVTVSITGDVLDEPLTAESTLAEFLADPRGARVLEPMLTGAATWGLTPEVIKLLGSIPMSRLARFPNTPFGPDDLDALVAEVDQRP
jgi:beta-glucosidase